ADATLIRPLPFSNADRLVMLWEHADSVDRGVVAPFEFDAWNTRNHVFGSMAAVSLSARAMTGPDGAGEQIQSQTVSVRYFDVLGITPIAGRTFVADDDRPSPDAVVLSEGLWRRRFGGDPSLIGKRITLDALSFTVIGIAPAGFQIFAPSEAWTILPTSLARGRSGVGHYLRVIGRLRPDATLDGARGDMTAIADAIATERPELNRGRGILLEPLHDGLIGPDLRLTSILLLGVVGFVLLTCCANVANLLLARTAARTRELAVRSALGAGRRRIARLLLTESLVLAGLAGVLGAAVGAGILAVAPSQIPAGVLPIHFAFTFDRRVLLFCTVTAFAVAMMFGLAPAWQSTRISLVQAMTSGGRAATGGGSRFRSALAIGQVAAAVLLLCGAGLLLRTLNALAHVDPGYRSRDVLTMVVSIPFQNPTFSGTYVTPAARRRFFESVENEVRSVPGVRNVAWGSALPLDGWWVSMTFQVEGDLPQPEAQRESARYQNVSPAYFETLGIPLVAGRAFTNRDTADGSPVCIVNEEFVRRHLKGRQPLGTHLVIRGMTTFGGPLPVREIVGVARQTAERPDEPNAQPQVYVPLAQDPDWQLSLVVQPTNTSAALVAPVRAAIARVDKERPVSKVRTLEGISREATSSARFRAVLLGVFATLALTLAVVGVFGVLAYSVQQRVREFGVRIALGATTRNVVLMVCGGTIRLIGAGLVIGLAAAVVLGRSISTFLFGVRPVDPVTFAGVAALLAVTAALATAVPALRAAKVDPIVALRQD
ncbi:MAG TPA: ABC transporter permease, partial [Vicinamibacterales bacterium]|nr:ABC transporter permease [Vicinamibacterales bacterium]